MKLLEFFQEDQEDWEIKNLDKLDRILTKLAEMVIQGQDNDPDYYGMVAAAVLDPDNNLVARLNFPGKHSRRVHAERAAMMAYTKKYGEIPEGSIIITTLSPCSDHMDERDGISCTELINRSPVHKVYCGYMDPSQHDFDKRKFTLQETNNANLRTACKSLADTFLNDSIDENFADGKHPEDKGDSRRHGIPKHATLAQLDKISHQGGRKGQLAHWQANMRRGRKKSHESLEENFTSKQQVINYFISRGKSAAQGAAAWERGWRGTTPKKPKESNPYDPSKYRFPYKDEAFDIGIGQSSYGKNKISENQLNELADRPYPYTVSYSNSKEIVYEFTNIKNKTYTVEIGKEGQGIYVIFGLGTDILDTRITKTGDAYRVFATVIDIIKNYVNQNHPQEIVFGSDAEEPSRTNLYHSFAKRVGQIIPGYEFTGVELDVYKDPQFTVRQKKNKISESINVADFKEILKKFLPLAKKVVKLQKMPTIVLKKTLHGGDQPTHGRFFNDSYTLELAIANRHPVDILRTLAHELTHAQQYEQHVNIDPTTGSPEENEANAVAGIVMRHFNKEYPEYLSFQPLEESKSNGRKRIC